MKSPADLFILIKSLNKNEKRFFKLFASLQTGDKNYLRLFDAIEKQKEHNETDIRTIFKGEKFLKQLSVTKEYLYKLILKSLDIYYAESSADSRLNRLLQHVQILFDKALYKQAMEILQKAKTLSTKYERYPQMFDILLWERRIIVEEYNPKILHKYMKGFPAKSRYILRNLQYLVECRMIQAELLEQNLKRGQIGSKSDQASVRSLKKLKALEGKPISDSARLVLNNANYFYHWSREDYKNAYRSAKKSVELQEAHPHRISESPYNKHYIADLNNMLQALEGLKQYDDFKKVLEKLKQVSSELISRPTEEIEAWIFKCAAQFELGFFRKTGKFHEGLHLIKTIEKGLLRFHGKVNRAFELIIYFNIAQILFGAGEYNKALKWNNKILDSYIRNKEFKEDLFAGSRMLNLIIHYELGNKALLEYITGSTYRVLHKRAVLFQFEKILIKFLKKISVIYESEEIKNEFRKLKEQIFPLLNDSSENILFEEFDYLSWIESKMENKSFQNIVEEKSNSGSLYE